jgi:hypothetical protein
MGVMNATLVANMISLVTRKREIDCQCSRTNRAKNISDAVSDKVLCTSVNICQPAFEELPVAVTIANSIQVNDSVSADNTRFFITVCLSF